MSPKNCNQRNRTARQAEMFLRGYGLQLVAGDRRRAYTSYYDALEEAAAADDTTPMEGLLLTFTS